MNKRIGIVFFLITISFYGFSQSTFQWQKCFGGLRNEVPKNIIQTSDGGYIIVGSAESGNNADTLDVKSNFGGSDFWVMKSTAEGSLTWQKHYGGSQNDVATGVIQLSDGGILVSGYSFSLDGDLSAHSPSTTNSNNEVVPNADYWVLKINSDGGIEWEKSLGGAYIDECFSMIETNDHHLMLAGFSSSNNGTVTGNHGGYDFWLVKMDLYGNELWNQTYGGSGDDRANNIIECRNGGFLVSGYSSSSDQEVSENFGLYDFWILRIDNAGKIMWQKSYGGSRDDRAFSAVETYEGDFAIAGFTWSDDGYINHFYGQQDGWLIRIDSLGNVKWEKSYGGSHSDDFSTILFMNDGGFILAGSSYSSDGTVTSNAGSSDCWVTKVKSNGDLEWTQSFGGSATDELNAITPAFQGGFIFAASTTSNDGDISGNHGNKDFWLVKLGTSAGLSESNDENAAFSVFPNPSNGTVEVKDNARHNLNEKMLLTITDLCGRIVAQNKISIDVTSTNKIDLSFLENGMYSVNLSSDKQTSTQKLIIRK